MTIPFFQGVPSGCCDSPYFRLVPDDPSTSLGIPCAFGHLDDIQSQVHFDNCISRDMQGTYFEYATARFCPGSCLQYYQLLPSEGRTALTDGCYLTCSLPPPADLTWCVDDPSYSNLQGECETQYISCMDSKPTVEQCPETCGSMWPNMYLNMIGDNYLCTTTTTTTTSTSTEEGAPTEAPTEAPSSSSTTTTTTPTTLTFPPAIDPKGLYVLGAGFGLPLVGVAAYYLLNANEIEESILMDNKATAVMIEDMSMEYNPEVEQDFVYLEYNPEVEQDFVDLEDLVHQEESLDLRNGYADEDERHGYTDDDSSDPFASGKFEG
eukprot:GHVH01009961.1.p2 GENE.GHVH01009961.1~~GHVH01009961.1.p2  ORF type:complete len:322 (-),score=47.41 GHVH01009961.1:1606-2571(-)